ncbi:DUF1801 domain-containing protein [Herbiconiux moechotypicola]|uniref:YdhG-like domain-containing protein n=1 Tax=Herbiconiux moechotypicola TaxID=637393 RepID=A0ABN3E587_9MICO|nr:DUF1801 domain-containing protein [Herbiconiux moechotypicola]MCS5731847.1 DUF1801 domain-containing protein [Herbiconiux moechotypicola]
MAEIKTRPTGADVTAFLDAVEPARRSAEGHVLRELFEAVTGEPGTMWGPTMVGFGRAEYTNTSGAHEMFVVGFSPRRGALTLYGVHDGYATEPDPLLLSLGPHTTGKACLYITRLDAVDRTVLEALVTRAWAAHTTA